MFRMTLLLPETRLSPQERIACFRRAFPKSLLCLVNGHIYGMWLVGNTYRCAYSAEYHGSYPHSYLRRVLSLFPDCPEPLHLFSGMVKGNLTIDLNRTVRPTIVSDARQIPLRDESQTLIVADPPYSEEDAKKYGTPWSPRPKAIKECHRVLKGGGFLVWLDTIYPQWSKKQWELLGLVAVVISTNHAIRQVTILQKHPIRV